MKPHVFEILTCVLSGLWKVAEACISIYISTVLILPCLILLWIINEIIRCVVSRRLKGKFGDNVTLVSSAEDNVWSFRKPGNSRNILMLTVFRNEIDYKSYPEKFSKRVLDYVNANGEKPFLKLCNIFTQQFGYGCWKKDSNFNITNHVRILPPGEGKPFHVESDLPDILATLTGDMSDEHPQWEEIILPKFVYNKDLVISDGVNTSGGERLYQLKPEGEVKSAKIFRYHHVYMEGVSSLIMMRTCMIEGSIDLSLDPLAPISMKGRWEAAVDVAYLASFGATTLIRHMYTEANSDSRFLLNRFSGRIIHRWSEPIDMRLLAKIQKKMTCTQAEVLACAIGGAIRTVSEKYCTKPIWLIFPDSFEDSVLMGLAKFVVPYPSESPMNRFGVVNVTIDTSSVQSGLERLKSVRKAFQSQVHRSPVLILNHWIMRYIGRFPLRIIQSLLADAGPPVVFSNIPWIKSKFSLMGDEVQEFAGWMPMLTRTGLGIVSARYADSMRLCGVSETSRLSQEELHFMLNEIGKELLTLAEECDA